MMIRCTPEGRDTADKIWGLFSRLINMQVGEESKRRESGVGSDQLTGRKKPKESPLEGPLVSLVQLRQRKTIPRKRNIAIKKTREGKREWA